MKLTSFWPHGRVFWRTFLASDTAYVFGQREGFVSSGGSFEYNHAQGIFQLELKRGDLFGTPIVAAGEQFTNDDELILEANGALRRIENVATVEFDSAFRTESVGTVTTFYRANAADMPIRITSVLTQVIGQQQGETRKVSQSAASEIGAKIGVEGGETTEGKVKVGVKVSGEVSAKVTSKVEQEVARQFNLTLSTTTTFTEDFTLIVKANTFVAVTTAWIRRFSTGRVRFGDRVIPFEATLGYDTSRITKQYDGPEALPPELLAVYREQYPGFQPGIVFAEGGVFREASAPEVYVIVGGAKLHVPDPGTLERLYGGWAAVRVVPDGSLARTGTTPNDAMLREEDDAAVYLMDRGEKRHVRTPVAVERLGGWGQVRVVHDGVLTPFPEGQAIAA